MRVGAATVSFLTLVLHLASLSAASVLASESTSLALPHRIGNVLPFHFGSTQPKSNWSWRFR
jgi:hypothetical protein